LPASSRRIEHPGEFSILKIPQSPGDDRPVFGDEQQLASLRHVADLTSRRQPCNSRTTGWMQQDSKKGFDVDSMSAALEL
jgi:hypothetical protein